MDKKKQKQTKPQYYNHNFFKNNNSITVKFTNYSLLDLFFKNKKVYGMRIKKKSINKQRVTISLFWNLKNLTVKLYEYLEDLIYTSEVEKNCFDLPFL